MIRFKFIGLIAVFSVGIGLVDPQIQGIFEAVKANDLAGVKSILGNEAALVETKDGWGLGSDLTNSNNINIIEIFDFYRIFNPSIGEKISYS